MVGFALSADDIKTAPLEVRRSYEREVQPRPKLGRWKAELDGLLTKNAESAARDRLTPIRLFEELRSLGCDGGYDAVRRYARVWSRQHAGQTAEAYVPLAFAPGKPTSSTGGGHDNAWSTVDDAAFRWKS